MALLATLLVILFMLDWSGALAEQWKFENLQSCSLSTLEIYNLESNETMDPCVLYDVGPNAKNNGTVASYDLLVTHVMVTSSNCRDHRDGAVVAIDKLNEDNEGKGLAIGFNENFFVGFRLISVVAGNPVYLGNEAYLALHKQLLNATLEATAGEFRFIIGTCSNYASIEKELAMAHETILTAQVGPPAFYTPSENPWVFGFHVNSDDYTAASIRKLQFMAKSLPFGMVRQAVRVIYRTSSVFFQSTCASAVRMLQDAGFTDVEQISYDPFADSDNDRIENFRDYDFLLDVADQICPPGSANNSYFRPALYLCTLTEQDLIFARLRENGCLLSSLWLTPATWGWALQNQNTVPYVQGAGQWHSALQYSDKYFGSGLEMLQYNEPRVGYLGGYDMLVSYAIPVFYASFLHTTYRVYDTPDPLGDIQTPEGREQLRRLMLNIRVNTIFGPVQFDDNQRNNGREAAAIQWQPQPDGTNNDALFSPDSQAQAELVVPALTAIGCAEGQFVNVSQLLDRVCLLESACSLCPAESYSTSPGKDLECMACPDGTTTDGLIGSLNCTKYEDNLLSNGFLSLGYVALSASWLMAILFAVWVVVYRKDPLVRLAQVPFLLLICVGGVISSASIAALAVQAGTGEDTQGASAGCKAAPILYSVGWIIQYGSLCAKTLRLSLIVDRSAVGRRATFDAWSSSYAVAIPLLIDVVILSAWTFVNPLEFQRKETGRNYEDGIVTIESIGRCRPSNADVSVWAFLGPLCANHLILVLVTHWLLWKVRNVSNRYQEKKYIGMAAVFAMEVGILGVPILIAAQDSAEATFFVITGIVALDNIGVLVFIFVPKIWFQRKGLEEGVTVGESILSSTHKKAVIRESGRRSFVENSSSASLQDTQQCFWDSKQDSQQFALGINPQLLPSIAENEESAASESDKNNLACRNALEDPAVPTMSSGSLPDITGCLVEDRMISEIGRGAVGCREKCPMDRSSEAENNHFDDEVSCIQKRASDDTYQDLDSDVNDSDMNVSLESA